MKAILLGNDVKEQIDQRLKNTLRDLGKKLGKDVEILGFELILTESEPLVRILTSNDRETIEVEYNHFLELLEQNYQDIKQQKRIQIAAAAGNLSRANGTVSEVYAGRKDYEKNLKLAQAVIGYGHKTISEHDYIVFGLEDVTPIVEQTLIGYRLTSFTIKSRRNVDFRQVGYYVPDFKDKNNNVLKNNSELQELYRKHMDSLFEKYGSLVDEELPVEDCRFILPYCYNSNIIMGCDANEFLRMTCDLLYGTNSNITELHDLGKKFDNIIRKQIPYLVPALEQEEKKKYNQDQYKFIDELIDKIVDETTGKTYSDLIIENAELLPCVHMTNYTKNADDTVLTSLLMSRYQLSNEQAKKCLIELEKKDANIRSKIMKSLIMSKNQRELEQVSFSFELPISLAVLTHFTRHRIHSLLVPSFVPMWNLDNYITPETVAAKYLDDYEKIFEDNKLMMEHFKNQGVRDEDLIYFLLSGNACNVSTTMNGHFLEWFSRMRCCNKAQWEIRELANQVVDEASKVAPLIGMGLGPTCKVEGHCPEGKDSCRNRGVVVKIKK